MAENSETNSHFIESHGTGHVRRGAENLQYLNSNIAAQTEVMKDTKKIKGCSSRKCKSHC